MSAALTHTRSAPWVDPFWVDPFWVDPFWVDPFWPGVGRSCDPVSSVVMAAILSKLSVVRPSRLAKVEVVEGITRTTR
jgi:hypothetical protein